MVLCLRSQIASLPIGDDNRNSAKLTCYHKTPQRFNSYRDPIERCFRIGRPLITPHGRKHLVSRVSSKISIRLCRRVQSLYIR